MLDRRQPVHFIGVGGIGMSALAAILSARGYRVSGSDPRRQLRAFQRERRQICQYINSMSLRGSGFGVFVLSCELDLSEALLKQIRN